MSKKFIITSSIIGIILVSFIVSILIYSPQKENNFSPTSIAKKTFPFLFPSGEENKETNTLSSQQTSGVEIQTGQRGKIVQLTKNAISSATYFEEKNKEKRIIEKIRYFEKATGNIYDINLQTNTTERISNTTISNIFEVYWSFDASKAVMRYTEKNNNGIEDIIRNFSISNIGASTTQGIFLPSSIKTIAPSKEENKIFYLALYEDKSVGLITNFENKNQKQVFSTPFNDFLIAWPNKNFITLLSRPASGINGSFYKLNLTTSSLEKILSGIPGLTANMSYDGENIIYSGSDQGGTQAVLYNLKENKKSTFDQNIIPEKCIWSHINKEIVFCAIPTNIDNITFPDDWYQGLISFSDRIWRINTKNGATEIITSEENYDFDLINPSLSKNENSIFFQNKKDGTLWNFKLLSQ